jgi:hypothetical protein
MQAGRVWPLRNTEPNKTRKHRAPTVTLSPQQTQIYPTSTNDINQSYKLATIKNEIKALSTSDECSYPTLSNMRPILHPFHSLECTNRKTSYGYESLYRNEQPRK